MPTSVGRPVLLKSSVLTCTYQRGKSSCAKKKTFCYCTTVKVAYLFDIFPLPDETHC